MKRAAEPSARRFSFVQSATMPPLVSDALPSETGHVCASISWIYALGLPINDASHPHEYSHTAAPLCQMCFAHPPYPPAPVPEAENRRRGRKMPLHPNETPELRGLINNGRSYECPAPFQPPCHPRKHAPSNARNGNGRIFGPAQILPAKRTRMALGGDRRRTF